MIDSSTKRQFCKARVSGSTVKLQGIFNLKRNKMNVEVLVRNTTREAFELGLKLIALDEVPFNKEFRCNGYKIIDNELFLSRYSDKCEKFPYEYNLQQTIDFAWGWYQANKKPTANEPDTDGSTKVAFELSTERSGVGSQDWGMFCSVKPIWFVYGK